MALGSQQLSGPPPSPELDPAAAAESNPMSMRALAGPGGNVTANGPQPNGGVGDDRSGLMQLGQKLSEGLLALAQAAPEIADAMHQCDGILKNALAQILETQAGTTTPGNVPMGAPPAPVTQTGTQYPGGGFGAGKPF